MTITNYRANRGMRNALIGTTAALAGTMARGFVNEAARRTIDNVGSYLTGGRQANLPRATLPGGSLRNLQVAKTNGRRRKTRKRARGRKNRSDGFGPTVGPMGAGVDDRISVTLRDSVVLNNSAANVHDAFYQIACVYTATRDMRTWLPRAGTTLTTVFRYFRVREIRLTFQPTVTYAIGGWIAIGVDPDPEAVLPGSLGNVIRHDPSFVGDVKDAHCLVWRPGDNEQNQDKITNYVAAATAPAHACQGVIQIYSNNDLLIGATLGLLWYEVDIEFYGLL